MSINNNTSDKGSEPMEDSTQYLEGNFNEIRPPRTLETGSGICAEDPHKLYNKISDLGFGNIILEEDGIIEDWFHYNRRIETPYGTIYLEKTTNPDIFKNIKNYYGEQMGKEKGGKKC